MLPLLLALAPAPTLAATVADATARRYAACAALIETDPAKAVDAATAWSGAGGSLPARQCLGLAYVAQERYAPAAVTFAQAAEEAEIQRDGRAATLWVMAGNASLANGDAGGARQQLDRALALPVLQGPWRGEALLDRARAQEAAANLKGARADLDAAVKLVPGDPMAWLLSATLARKEGDPKRAAADIAEAEKRAPGDPDVAAEARLIRSGAQAAAAIDGTPVRR